MNKSISILKHLFGILAIVALCGVPAQAERMLTENFEYTLGNLYQQGGWIKYSTQTASPVQVVDEALTYPGYQETAVGKSVKLEQVASGQDMMIPFTSTAITSGKVYASALVKVNAVADDVYFFVLLQPTNTGMVDGKSPLENARLLASKCDTEGKFVFKISRNSATLFETTGEYELGGTYLVVMSYEFVDGTKNDIIRLWVNPVTSGAEPEPTIAINSATHTGADMSKIQGLELRQGSSATKTGPAVVVDAIHVGTAWSDLFDSAPVAEPNMIVTPHVTYDGSPVAIGQQATYATYTVEYANLAEAVSVYVTGANSDQFEVSEGSIPAGSGTATITLNYKPQSIGKHTARINFESNVSTLNTGYAANAIAWNPATPPTISVNTEGLKTFECKAGASVQQTITVSTSDLIDYGSATVSGTANGAFIINNATLLKNGDTKITITFKPLVEGNYTDVVKFTALNAESKSVTVKGVATADDVSGKEGDQLPLDESNALTSYVQNFDGVVKNQALSLEGWKNLAQVGTRAWWGYTWDDGNGAAKVTPYDSKSEESTPCVMTLVSPALDFKNSANPVLTFKLMGTLMREGMNDALEVCYIEKDGESMYVEPIQGLNIPCTPDQNSEWVPFTIDLKGLDLADTFFIGFRFKSNRGTESTTSYFVDDFTWGQTNVPLIRTSVRELKFPATIGKKATSPEIGVEGVALTSPISISMYGADKDKFTLSTTGLPAEGGKFTLDFIHNEQGVFAVEVDLASEGAPVSAVVVGADNQVPTGISTVVINLEQPVSVYDLQGRVLINCEKINSLSHVKATFGEGIYVVKQGEKACKVKL